MHLCLYLHAVAVLCLVVQLHHGLVLADHARSGGLASTWHGADRKCRFLPDGPQGLARRLRFASGDSPVDLQWHWGIPCPCVGCGPRQRVQDGGSTTSQDSRKQPLPRGVISGWRAVEGEVVEAALADGVSCSAGWPPAAAWQEASW